MARAIRIKQKIVDLKALRQRIKNARRDPYLNRSTISVQIELLLSLVKELERYRKEQK
jgi:hypothetical protein